MDSKNIKTSVKNRKIPSKVKGSVNTMKFIRNHNQSSLGVHRINYWRFASVALPRDPAWAQPAVFDQPRIAPIAARSRYLLFYQSRSRSACCGSCSPYLPPFCRYSRYEGTFRWFERLVLPVIIRVHFSIVYFSI